MSSIRIFPVGSLRQVSLAIFYVTDSLFYPSRLSIELLLLQQMQKPWPDNPPGGIQEAIDAETEANVLYDHQVLKMLYAYMQRHSQSSIAKLVDQFLGFGSP
ncbi:hypothetical protein DVH24_035489 [Malus domestica]|uniref:Uncharacterized protein n=1 Tax=Malus domestica TaxID=3750 RepID=A0A498J7F6_MALDO|nr:hypothetical protein DVH24_035489 [Malus domestica]